MTENEGTINNILTIFFSIKERDSYMQVLTHQITHKYRILCIHFCPQKCVCWRKKVMFKLVKVLSKEICPKRASKIGIAHKHAEPFFFILDCVGFLALLPLCLKFRLCLKCVLKDVLFYMRVGVCLLI